MIATPILSSASTYINIYVACIDSATAAAAVSDPNISPALPVSHQWLGAHWFYLDTGDAM